MDEVEKLVKELAEIDEEFKKNPKDRSDPLWHTYVAKKDAIGHQTVAVIWIRNVICYIVLLNRADRGSEEISVQWIAIDFSPDHPAVVRDFWTRKDLGVFTGNYTSPKIDSHAVMMLNITLTK